MHRIEAVEREKLRRREEEKRRDEEWLALAAQRAEVQKKALDAEADRLAALLDSRLAREMPKVPIMATLPRGGKAASGPTLPRITQRRASEMRRLGRELRPRGGDVGRPLPMNFQP